MPRKKHNAPAFAVGEPVVMQHPAYFVEWDGALGVVVGGLTWRWGST